MPRKFFFLPEVLSIFLLVPVFSCASLTSDQPESLKLEDAPVNEGAKAPPAPELVKFEMSTGLSPKPATTEWISCRHTAGSGKGLVLLMHGEDAGFDPASFCSQWHAQIFLISEFDVLGINRPGFGKSTGEKDLVSSKSIARILEGYNAAVKSLKITVPPVGAWGYGFGAVAAGFVGRQIGKLNWIIFGGGVYDLDEVNRVTTDEKVRELIQAAVKREGQPAIDDRSLSYDVSGLPRVIAMYHGKDDSVFPPSQAENMRAALSSSQHQASLQYVDGLGHELTEDKHRQILKIVIGQLNANSARK